MSEMEQATEKRQVRDMGLSGDAGLSHDVIKSQWDRICSRLQRSQSDRFAVRWLSKIVPDKIEGHQVSLLLPSPCIHELVKRNYADQILSLWQQENAEVSGLNLKLAQQQQPELPLASPAMLKPSHAAMVLGKRPVDPEMPQSLLDPTHTFDTFVVGPSNEFAHAAARRIAEDDSVAFNQLYIHGGSGLGKTHLMHAIAWRIKELHPDKTVLYLSSEQFFLQFMKAMRQNNRYEGTARFREIFRSVDVLMIDDVQFICGKDATQDEFFNTFNYLIAHGKKIILSADSAPQDLRYVKDSLKSSAEANGIADRLKTRITQGLVVNILPTSYELRLGILQEKVRAMNTLVPEDILDFLAKNITSNIRELEGALKRIVAHAELLGAPINLETTRAVLKDLLHVTEKEITVKEIQYAVCGHYQIGLTDLKSTRRDRNIARPRQLAMYLAKMLTPRSLPSIGGEFGRDHTTVIHAVKTIENLLSRDAKLAADADMLIRRLKGEAA